MTDTVIAPAASATDALSVAALLAASDRVHFVGIGGAGMSGLARILRRRGLTVSGSDGRASQATALLEREGIPVAIGHRAESVAAVRGLVIASAAIAEDNPELVAARHAGVPIVKYALGLAGAIATRKVIAIAGSHGKTSTTALTSFALRHSGIDCGFVIGGRVPQLEGSAGDGKSDSFVVEACEFDRSFLHFTPAAAAITNIDADHLDYFGSLDGVEAAFAEFVMRIRPEGELVTTYETWQQLEPRLLANPQWAARRIDVLTLGTEQSSSFRVIPLPPRGGRGVAFRLFAGRNDLGAFHLRLAGAHHRMNGAMAVLLGLRAGAPIEKLRTALGEFTGVDRRLAVRFSGPELMVLDDYGHHPTELRATIAAAREAYAPAGDGRRLVLVFQPHQYSRTRLLFDEFVDALAGADRVILPEIYAARDSDADKAAVSSAALAAALVARGVDAVFRSTLEEATEEAWSAREFGDVVLTSGAGDVDRVADELVRRAEGR